VSTGIGLAPANDATVHERNKWRIAYVIQNAGNDLAEDVGQAILIKHTIRGLRRADHLVSVFRLQGRTVAQMDNVFNLSDVRSVSPGFSGTGSFLFAESAVRRLQRELRLPYLALFDAYRFYEACCRFLPDFTLCHEYGGLFSIGAALACRRRRIPHVLTVEADPFLENRVKGTPLRGLRAFVAAAEARIAFGLADKIITVSEQARKRLIDHWRATPEKIEVLPNGVDVELFQPDIDCTSVRRELGQDGAPVVGFVGGFQIWHGLEHLVESFALVLREIPQTRLLLVGDGPARPLIERKITELGLESAVTVTGLVPQARVPEMLAAADVAVLPYPRLPEELWFSPLKLYEYMAAGKAIVASADGQITQVIEPGQTGLLVEPGNIGQLAQTLVTLLRDSEERARLGRNARQQAVERHSWGQYIEQLEQVYSSTLQGLSR
jgi:glycosyltransferase involved in cell wall biosynthesis